MQHIKHVFKARWLYRKNRMFIDGGIGVGRVTKAGLPVAVGRRPLIRFREK